MKKIILLFALILTLSNLGFSQNILFLKNGDKMNGKLEGFINDTVIFKIQGNNLKFYTSDIVSIFFDENQATATNEIKPVSEAKIFGVVTYFFNDNYGYKPDVGAEVYVADSAKNSSFDFATVDTFYLGSKYRSIYLDYKSMGKNQVPERVIARVKEYNVIDEASFNSLDERANKNLRKIVYSTDVTRTVVDGNGNYSVKIQPGTYYVYIKSINRKGINLTEIRGKIYCKKVTVKEGEETNVSHKFEVN
jgi:hypothetical protein